MGAFTILCNPTTVGDEADEALARRKRVEAESRTWCEQRRHDAGTGIAFTKHRSAPSTLGGGGGGSPSSPPAGRPDDRADGGKADALAAIDAETERLRARREAMVAAQRGRRDVERVDRTDGGKLRPVDRATMIAELHAAGEVLADSADDRAVLDAYHALLLRRRRGAK